MAHPPSSLAHHLGAIRERIENAAQRSGRRASDVTLVGISKGVSAERIREAFNAGVTHFGENRVQEWESKVSHFDDFDATWHFVGHLQRNKAAKAVALFHTVDSLDSLPLAEKLDHAAGEGRRLPVLLEVRLDPAHAKSGCDPAALPRLAEGVLLLPHLELRGLMSVPAPTADPREARPFFRQLRELRDHVANQLDWPLAELSMGMSHDFDVAIEEGATQIRVGTALFGNRAREVIDVREVLGGVTFSVRVQRRSIRNEILGEWQGALRLRLAAPPVDDRANEALIRFIAERLKVPMAAVTLLRGARSRTKQIEVRGATAPQVRALAVTETG